jgi:hypothetical protein
MLVSAQELVMKTIFVISVLFCLAVINTAEAAEEGSFTSPTMAQTATSPLNALDAQARARARELEQAHADVRRRLGDRNPESTIRDQDFTAPNTNTTNYQKP